MTRVFSRNNARIFDRVLLSKTKIGVHVCGNGISFFACSKFYEFSQESSSLISGQLFLFHFHRFVQTRCIYRFDFRTKKKEKKIMNRARSRDYSFLFRGSRNFEAKSHCTSDIFRLAWDKYDREAYKWQYSGSDRLGNSRVRSTKQLGL